ncbi:MAG: nitroreductase family deazaflavin-dependent oxidoreductase [Chloroflexota bacterium]
MPAHKLTPLEKFLLRAEDIIMTRLVPMDRPGAVFKWLFKVPILFYKIGLPLFGGFILLLTTTGRKSGKPRHTPLEYRREAGTGHRIIMAGWGGDTDWRKNIEANPRVHVQAGWTKYNALAEKLTDNEVADFLAEAMRLNPRSERIWSRWAGEPVRAQERESLLRAAKFFPSFRLLVVRNGIPQT